MSNHRKHEVFMRKKRKWIIIGIIILILIIGFGGKKMLDHQAEVKELAQEKQIALQAKKMFKDIKQIKIEKGFEGSPGSRWFGIDVIQENGNKFHATVQLNDSDSYYTKGDSDAINQEGQTLNKVIVVFSNNEKEEIK